MRHLVVLIVGLLAGAVLAGMFASAMQRRNAFPRALMTVMQHELGSARAAARAGQCSTPAQQRAAEHLRLIGGELEGTLLAADAKDRVLSQYVADFGKTVAAWNPASTCPDQAEALTAVANACEACHRDYR